MAPQGFLGAATGAAAAGLLAAVFVAACEGAPGVAGAAWRWVTLLDCCPNDLPPPMRFAASACPVSSPKLKVTNQSHLFMLSPVFINVIKFIDQLHSTFNSHM
jgi:hypothetical protein